MSLLKSKYKMSIYPILDIKLSRIWSNITIVALRKAEDICDLKRLQTTKVLIKLDFVLMSIMEKICKVLNVIILRITVLLSWVSWLKDFCTENTCLTLLGGLVEGLFLGGGRCLD